MKQTIFVRFSYADRVSEEVPIHLDINLDLTNNTNRKRLLNKLLKSNPNITEILIK